MHVLYTTSSMTTQTVSTWEWLDGSHWTPYDTQTSDIIENAYQQNNNGTVLLTHGFFGRDGVGYRIDFATLTQTRLSTAFIRKIKRVTATVPQLANSVAVPVWEWQSENGWMPYDATTCGFIETGFSTGVPEITLQHSFFGSQGGYTIDFTTMIQRKKATGYERRLRRVFRMPLVVTPTPSTMLVPPPVTPNFNPPLTASFNPPITGSVPGFTPLTCFTPVIGSNPFNPFTTGPPGTGVFPVPNPFTSPLPAFFASPSPAPAPAPAPAPVPVTWEYLDPDSDQWTPYPSVVSKQIEGMRKNKCYSFALPSPMFPKKNCKVDLKTCIHVEGESGKEVKMRRNPPLDTVPPDTTGKKKSKLFICPVTVDPDDDDDDDIDLKPTPTVDNAKEMAAKISYFKNIARWTTFSFNVPKSDADKTPSTTPSTTTTNTTTATTNPTEKCTDVPMDAGTDTTGPVPMDAGVAGTAEKTPVDPTPKADNPAPDSCPICMSEYEENSGALLQCKHHMCVQCVIRSFKQDFLLCPFCKQRYGIQRGIMPEGRMQKIFYKPGENPLEGYETIGTIMIKFYFENGIQGPLHPNPDQPYYGTSRKAFLPDNEQGRKLLQLFEIAWERKLLFTIGTSVTTGHENQVIWNGVHMKTNTHGGTANYAFPDPTYFERVTGELADKGVCL